MTSFRSIVTTANMTVNRHPLVVALAILLISCTVLIECGSDAQQGHEAPQGSTVEPKQSARSQLSLSGMLNFEEFKTKFHKRYNSILEEISRRRLYIGHAIESITSKLAYKIRMSNSFKSINHMSDWTLDQFRRTLMKRNRTDIDAHSRDIPIKRLHIVSTATGRARTRSMELRREEEVGADRLFHDYRDCMVPAKDQGQCGACYMFSVSAMFEWMYCKQTGSRQSFSEQYAIDCGQHGCAGGFVSDSIEFYKNFGFITDQSYPYFERKKRCMFHKIEAKSKAPLGEIRVKNVEKYRLDLNNRELDNNEVLAVALDDGPVLVTISLNKEFYKYGGGVDDALGCSEEIEIHAMLLVGDGVEDGNDYWLIKNSHGADWGENGYYKLNKRATDRCLDISAGSGIQIESGYKFVNNSKYDSSIVDKMLPVWQERLAGKAKKGTGDKNDD